MAGALMLEHFHIRTTLDDIIRHRKGEVKLGERFRFLDPKNPQTISKYKKTGLRFALIGIPESVGVLANHGTSGSENSWQEFLYRVVNLQSNRFLDGSEVLCLGQVETKDLQDRAIELDPREDKYFTKLKSLCQELDQRVSPVIEFVVRSGLIPIIIGGGHNNAFPILKGVCDALQVKNGMACINLDAHADFRPLEGRHSGNAFSYAFYKKYLQRYYISGINEQANSETMLKNIDLEDCVAYSPYRAGIAPEVSKAISFIHKNQKLPVGLEIDMDALTFVPASAYTVHGYSIEQAGLFIREINQKVNPVYLHLAEGQIREPGDARIIGSTLTFMVMEFIKSYTA